MPYRAELEKYRALRDTLEAYNQAVHEQLNTARLKRVEELVAHLQEEDAASVGLKIEWEKGHTHVRLRGEKFDILIEVDVDDYTALIFVPSKKRWGEPRNIVGPPHKRSTLKELDILILDAIKTLAEPQSTNVRFGSLADKLSRAESHPCPLVLQQRLWLSSP
jgi:hypothetical protein